MFVPHSEIDLKKMFEELSISSLDDLFTHIPETLKLNDGLNVPPSLSELESSPTSGARGSSTNGRATERGP